ncbi:MAG: hypothetical protein ACXWLM_12340, partial [Myxococcales bacterium]
LGRIVAAAQALPELGYELYLFSDHGQAATRPAEEVLGESLGEHLLAHGVSGGGESSRLAAKARWLRRLSTALPGILGTGALAYARHVATSLDAGQPAQTRADGPLLIVPAGDIAHLYSTQAPEPIGEPEIRARHPGLLERCASSAAIGFALVRGERGPIALRGDRRLELDRAPDAAELARVVGHPLAAMYSRDLLQMRTSGDVILLGTAAPGLADIGEGRVAPDGATRPSTVAFPYEFGSHGGLSPDQLDIFVVHPEELGENAFESVVRPQDLHRFFVERKAETAPLEEAAQTCAS